MTSILQVWHLALAWSFLAELAVKIPRRLIWVVNRRVVVDQATDEALAIAATLRDLEQLGDDELIVGLQSYSQTGGLLAISTLRGERADNREWSKDPSTPAGRKPVKWAYNPTVARMSEKVGEGILAYRLIERGYIRFDLDSSEPQYGGQYEDNDIRITGARSHHLHRRRLTLLLRALTRRRTGLACTGPCSWS